MKSRKIPPIAIILLLATQLYVSTAFAQTKPAVELEGAIAKEQVDGDLKTAIAIYQKIAADTSAPRDVRAKALLHLAGCYEKLGKQAQTVYQQIVRDYGDQPEAAKARARLAALKQADRPSPRASITQRKIDMPGDSAGPGDTDGRRAVYFDKTTKELIYGDLASKSRRVILREKPGNPFGASPSRDFSMVAVYFHVPDNMELYSVVKIDGTGYRELAKVDGEYGCWNWSWDNRYLLLCGQSGPGPNRLLRISVADGQVRELLNLKTAWVWFATFSPDGRFVAYQTRPTFQLGDVSRIFVMPAEGGEPQLVYEDRQPGAFGMCRLLDWTADGRFLAFASERTGKGALHLLPIREGRSAGAPVFVKYGDFEGGVTTAGGGLIYSSAKPGGVWAIYLATLDPNSRPSNWRRLNLPLGNTSDPWPKFSEDGKQIVYVAMNGDAGQAGGRVVHLRNLSSGEDREVYHAFGVVSCVLAVRQPKLFCIDSTEETKIFSIGVDSSEIARLHSFPVLRPFLIEYASRDGRALYLDEFLRGETKLVQWEIATAKETILVSSGVYSVPSVSPDERWLVRWYKQNIEIHPMPGGDWKPVVSLKDYGQFSLTPDAKWVFYHDVDSRGKDSLFRIATAGGTPERVGDLPTSGRRGTMEISQDGSKIMISAGEYDTGFELWSLENFVPPAPKR